MSKINVAKKVLSTFIAMAVMTSVCTSCNNKSSGKDNKNGTTKINQAREIKNYFLKNDMSEVIDMTYIENMLCSGEDIFVKGYSKMDNSNTETFVSIVDIMTGEVVDIDTSVLNYSYIEKVMFNKDNIYVNYADENYDGFMAVIDRNTSEVNNTIKVDSDSYIMSSFFDADENIIIISETYSGMSVGVSCVKYDGKTLEKLEEIDFSEKLGLAENEMMVMMMSDGAGGFFGVSANMEAEEITLYKFSSSMELIYTVNDFSDMPGEIGGVFVAKNGNPCVLTMDYGEDYDLKIPDFFVNELSTEDGSVVERYEPELDSEYPMIHMTEKNDKYDFIYNGTEGLCGYNLAEKKSEVIVAYSDTFSEAFENCYGGFVDDNKIILSAQSYGEGSGEMIYQLDSEGNMKNEVSLDIGDGYVQDMDISGDGTIYFLVQEHDESVNDEGEYVYESNYSLISIKDGKQNKIGKIEELSSQDSYVSDFAVSSDNSLYCLMSIYDDEEGKEKERYYVYKISSDGKVESSIEFDETIQYCTGMISTKDAVYVSYHSDEANHGLFSKLDFENKTVGESLNLKIDPNALYSLEKGDEDYDFYYSVSDGYYGFNIAENKSTEIVNWIDSDLDIRLDKMCIVDKDNIICTFYPNSVGKEDDYSLKFARLTRADEETLKKVNSKKIITLAGENIAYSNIYDDIMNFNAESQEYRIQVNDYAKYGGYNEEADEYFPGATKLNTDILSGDIPDILIGSYDLDLSAYAAKGMLTDLNTYFEKDGEIKREDYFESVLDAFSSNGKLYQLPTNFVINTFVGKTSELGNEAGWTYDEFFEFAESKNGSDIFYDMYKNDIFNLLVTENLHEFVDFNAKTCSFDSGKFEKILEFVSKNGKNDDERDENDKMYDEDHYTEQFNRFRDNKCYIDALGIYDFYSISEFQFMTVGEEVTFKGYPTESDGSGAIISTDSLIGISEKSKVKDEAWNFVRKLLLPENQYDEDVNGGYFYGFPLHRESFDKALKAHQNEFKQNENIQYTPEGEEIKLRPVETTTADKLMDMIENAPKATLHDSRIVDVISEQYDIFIEGGQSAKETADAVQSKVSLYLKEIG